MKALQVFLRLSRGSSTLPFFFGGFGQGGSFDAHCLRNYLIDVKLSRIASAFLLSIVPAKVSLHCMQPFALWTC